MLDVNPEPNNIHDAHAVAKLQRGVVVGHLPNSQAQLGIFFNMEDKFYVLLLATENILTLLLKMLKCPAPTYLLENLFLLAYWGQSFRIYAI